MKQGQAFGGESGEDSDGKKVPKKGAKGAAKKGTEAATPAAESRAARFDSRDADHDGKISWEEFLASASDQKGAQERFEKYDFNRDGTITRDEFMK